MKISMRFYISLFSVITLSTYILNAGNKQSISKKRPESIFDKCSRLEFRSIRSYIVDEDGDPNLLDENKHSLLTNIILAELQRETKPTYYSLNDNHMPASEYIINFLLDHGADVNAIFKNLTGENETNLHLLAGGYMGKYKWHVNLLKRIVELLLKYGAETEFSCEQIKIKNLKEWASRVMENFESTKEQSINDHPAQLILDTIEKKRSEHDSITSYAIEILKSSNESCAQFLNNLKDKNLAKLILTKALTYQTILVDQSEKLIEFDPHNLLKLSFLVFDTDESFSCFLSVLIRFVGGPRTKFSFYNAAEKITLYEILIKQGYGESAIEFCRISECYETRYYQNIKNK